MAEVSSNDLIDLVEFMTLEKMSEMHTITIAKIVKVENTTIDVKPVFKRRLDDREIEYPVFTKVPPLFNYGGVNYHAFPLAVGDYCLLLVNERAFDNWYEGLDNNSPLEYRMFDYSDSFALPMAKNKLGAIQIPNDGRTHLIGNTYQQGNYTHIGDREQTGNQTINGNLTVNGQGVGGDTILNNTTLTIPATSDLIIDDGNGNMISLREFLAHIHGGVTTGSGNTDVPIL